MGKTIHNKEITAIRKKYPQPDEDLKKDLDLRKENTAHIVKYAARIAEKKGAGYVNILEMKNRLIITDYFIIIGAGNTRLTGALEDELRYRLKELGLNSFQKSGTSDSNWILIDYDDFVIHIFTEEYRQYYDLERLWKDSKIIEYK